MGLTVTAVPGDGHALRPPGIAFVIPLHATVITLVAGRSELVVDRATWAVVPPRLAVKLRATSHACRVMVLDVRPALIEHVVESHRNVGVEQARLERWLGTLQVLPRTVWVFELAQRYLFERHALGVASNETTQFLETELVKEAYFLCRDREAGTERPAVAAQRTPLVERALQRIEEQLFEPLLVDRLAAALDASESTLLRAFKREVGTTPAAYWRARRLDEALVLLRAPRVSVLDVALAIGYESAAAFTQAFQARFGRPPSAFVSRRPARPAP